MLVNVQQDSHMDSEIIFCTTSMCFDLTWKWKGYMQFPFKTSLVHLLP